MNDRAPAPPSLRPRRIVLLTLAIVVVAGAVFVVRRPLFMAAPTCMAGRWHGCGDTVNGVLFMMVAALPLAAVAVWILARHRRGDALAWRTSLADVGLVYGTVPMVWLTLQPGMNAGTLSGEVSLVPLRDLAAMGPIGIAGNLLIFAALGFFAPMRFSILASLPRILVLAAGCSALVEVAQYVLLLDRVSSVDDVLVNAVGAGLAALASRRWWRTTPATPNATLPAPSSSSQPAKVRT